jgi:hypothetical protein
MDRLAEAAYEATIDVSFHHGNDYSEIADSEVRELDIVDVRSSLSVSRNARSHSGC